MKKQVKIGLAVVVVCVICVLAFFNMNKPVLVDTVIMEPHTATQYYTEKGIVCYENIVSIYSLVSGKVTQLLVQEGDRVTVGQPLCNVDTFDIDLQIANAKAQIQGLQDQKNNLDAVREKENDSIKQQINSLEKQLEILNVQQSGTGTTQEEQVQLQHMIISQNEIDITRAKSDYDKMKTLFENGIISTNELEIYKKTVETLEVQLDQNNQQLKLIESGNAQASDSYYQATSDALKQQIADLNKVVSKDYNGAMKKYYDTQIVGINTNIDQLTRMKDNSVILSTESGVITNLPIKDSNLVNITLPIAEIATGLRLVEVYVSTNDISTISIGKKATLILKRRENDESYNGTIVKIEDRAETKISSLGVEEQKVKVYIQPDEHEDLFKNGYDVDVKFLAYEKENALILPKTAIFKDGNEYKVWEVKDGKLVKTTVTEGVNLINDIIIESGIVVGSEIVKDASLEELKEGIKVN